MDNITPTPIENDSPASTSTPLTAQPNVEQTSPTPPTSTSQPPELTHFVMPGTFNNDDQITSIVDSKVQPPSPAIPPPQSSTSSSLFESSTPESAHHPLNDPDISATLSQISDNQDT